MEQLRRGDMDEESVGEEGRDVPPKPRFALVMRAVHSRANAVRRLHTELDRMKRDPVEGCTASPRGDNLFEWAAVIEGPKGSVYEGGTFFLDIEISESYPYTPPKVTFLTRIYHCNIDYRGTVSMDILEPKKWSSTMTISHILKSIISLMCMCNAEDPVVDRIAVQYLTDRCEFERTARMWTKRFAA